MFNKLSRKFAVSLLTVGALAFGGTGVQSSVAAESSSKVKLEEGHTDLFNVIVKDGQLVMNLKEDITGHSVLRNPEEVVLVVKESAYDKSTKDVPGVEMAGYYLPLNQKPGILWPGWDTLGVSAGGFNAIDINFLEVKGPGRVKLASQTPFGGVSPLLKGGSYDLKTGAVREQTFPAHTHAHWIFEKPGIYTMKVNATGTKEGKKYTSNTATYTWHVGDFKIEPPKPPVAPEKPVPTPPAVEKPTKPEPTSPAQPPVNEKPKPVETPKAKPTPTSPKEMKVPSAPKQDVTKKPIPAPKSKETKCYLKTVSGQAGLRSVIRDDRSTPAVMRDPRSVPFLLGPAAKTKATADLGGIKAGSEVWMIGATQVSGIPWLGANTMNASLLNNTRGPVTWSLTSFSGPGNMEVFTSGNFGKVVGNKWFSASPGNPRGNLVLDRNTHVHPNWVFSAPGTYRVGITQSVKSTSGATLRTTSTLVFHVGSGTGVTNGHFDLGAEYSTTSSQQWLTADGKPCPTIKNGKQLAAGYVKDGNELAATGSNSLTIPFVVFALGAGVFGLALIRTRRTSNAR
ncbi:TIGR03773 family transporter-associated surface protein [Actinomycetaceae bacterium TAE3-ERU4]|nr:TIGR03773 family transporter-associated surface protein [Actinomycetaceae bacterium TAE3-ERU4]